MNDSILARRLKNLREEHGYYQKYVADKLGIKSNTLSGYENGTRMPDPIMLSKLADLYNVSADYLLGKDKSKNDANHKDESDIAKRLKRFEAELENSDGLAFDGEPLSQEARESLLESVELLFRQTQRINKKYTPKKYRNDE